MSAESNSFPRAGFFKRIAAIVYDFLVVVTLAMLVTALNLLVIHLLSSYQLLNLAGEEPSQFLNAQWWFQLELVLAVWLFFAWFWYDGGQTIGMRAWRLKVESDNEQPLTLKRTLLRALYALLGFGNLWVLFTRKNKQSLQDKLSQTRVVVLSKQANKAVYLRGVEGQE
ncbi:MAG: RDD family protein [Gammaproteobacteria bacterium]|nr:RDD family protein [Gammaproteobacteria bacterium]